MRTERVSWVNNLETIQDLFLRVGHEATYESSGNHNSFTIYHVIVRPTKDHKILILKILYFLEMCSAHFFFGSLNNFGRSEDIHDNVKKLSFPLLYMHHHKPLLI